MQIDHVFGIISHIFANSQGDAYENAAMKNQWYASSGCTKEELKFVDKIVGMGEDRNRRNENFKKEIKNISQINNNFKK